MYLKPAIFALTIFLISCSSEHYDIIIKNGTIIDGSGQKGYVSDLGIKNGKINKTPKKEY